MEEKLIELVRLQSELITVYQMYIAKNAPLLMMSSITKQETELAIVPALREKINDLKKEIRVSKCNFCHTKKIIKNS